MKKDTSFIKEIVGKGYTELNNHQDQAVDLEIYQHVVKVDDNTNLHPFLADRPGRIYILKSNTFKALFSTTYVKDLWKITPTVKDILLSNNSNGNMPRNLYAVRLTLVSWFVHLEGRGRDDTEIKLQEYVNFVRLARNEFYNVDFKINKRKFIAGVKRSTTMAEYLEMIKG